MRSRNHIALSTDHCPLSTPAFTMVEMLTVLGIVALVAAMSLPLLIPMMRTRTLDSAVDTVKSACNLARSTAIQQRRMINLTFLQQTDATHGPGIVLTGYNFAGAVTAVDADETIHDINQNWTSNCFRNDALLLFSAGTPTPQIRKIQSNTTNTIAIYEQNGQPYNPADSNDPNQPDWTTPPTAGNTYVIMSASSPAQPYCIHCLDNYNYNNPMLPAAADARFSVMKAFSLYMGETIQYLPAGCQFTFAPAWSPSVTYVQSNVVSYKGIDYFCSVLSSLGSEPPSSNWQPCASLPGAYAEAWTYVFLPDGEVWSLPPNAGNSYNGVAVNGVTYGPWFRTTYMANGGASGPKIWGPQNLTSATIIVYATTGQVISQ